MMVDGNQLLRKQQSGAHVGSAMQFNNLKW